MICFHYVLEKLQHDERQLDLFFGLLGGVMIATSGHRPGVIMNLTMEEFQASKGGKDGHAIFVSVVVVIVLFTFICLYI